MTTVMFSEDVDRLALEFGAVDRNGWIAFERFDDAVAFGEMLDEAGIEVDPPTGDVDVAASVYVGESIGFLRR